MSCTVYVSRYDISCIERGQKKKFESNAGRALLGRAVSDVFGVDMNELEMSLGEHGKPYFKDRTDIRFNISHSEGFAAAAVCTSEVGVDIQAVRRISDGLIDRICRGAEIDYINNCDDGDRNHAFIRLWALKESYIKAIGMGMAFPMNEINFDMRVKSGFLGQASNRNGYYYLHDGTNFSLAVCCLEEKAAPDIVFI